VASIFRFEEQAEQEINVKAGDRPTLNGLHGVIFQKMELFITTAERISDPT
jgi:hypothetical protein